MAESDGSKTCRDCSEKKAVALFDRSGGNKDGYSGQCKACRAIYYRANADRYRAHAKNWRQADPERAARRDKAQREANKEARAADSQQWRGANQERVREYNREYVQGHLEYFRGKCAQRRLRIAGSVSHYTPQDVQELLQLQRGRCAVCHEKMVRYEVDHVHPLSKGGGNGRDNIQLLCMHCNRTKHDKDPIEFMQSRGLLL